MKGQKSTMIASPAGASMAFTLSFFLESVSWYERKNYVWHGGGIKTFKSTRLINIREEQYWKIINDTDTMLF